MNMTTKQLQTQMGVFEEPTGVYFINPASGLFTIKGATSTANFCTAGQTTPCFAEPAPGQMGNLSYDQFNLPWFFDQDLSMVKDIKIFERLNLQLRLEAFDVFNNVELLDRLAGVFDRQFHFAQFARFHQLRPVDQHLRHGPRRRRHSRIVQWGMRFVF